jgi:hypothetical protein
VREDWLVPFVWNAPQVLAVDFAHRSHQLAEKGTVPDHDPWAMHLYATRITERALTLVSPTTGSTGCSPCTPKAVGRFAGRLGIAPHDVALLDAAARLDSPEAAIAPVDEALGGWLFMRNISEQFEALKAQRLKLSQPKVAGHVDAMIERVPEVPEVAVLKPLLAFGPEGTVVPDVWICGICQGDAAGLCALAAPHHADLGGTRLRLCRRSRLRRPRRNTQRRRHHRSLRQSHPRRSRHRTCGADR